MLTSRPPRADSRSCRGCAGPPQAVPDGQNPSDSRRLRGIDAD